MNAPLPTEKHAHGHGGPRRRARQTGGADLGRDSDRDARRVAAAILEVLAGARTPTEAAAALTVSVPRYYQLESQALRGLLAACTPKPKGRVRRPERELTQLRQENQRLQREVSRQQALVRASQRTVGLAAPLPTPARKPGKKKPRRPVARALSVAARLQQQNVDPVPPTEVPSNP